MWYLMITIVALAVGYAIGVMMREKRYYDLRHDYLSLSDWMYRQVVQNGKDAVLRAEARKVLTELNN